MEKANKTFPPQRGGANSLEINMLLEKIDDIDQA